MDHRRLSLGASIARQLSFREARVDQAFDSHWVCVRTLGATVVEEKASSGAAHAPNAFTQSQRATWQAWRVLCQR